jgi:regulator of protease activity HflC (stomatin/prohibitin superfamily)
VAWPTTASPTRGRGPGLSRNDGRGSLDSIDAGLFGAARQSIDFASYTLTTRWEGVSIFALVVVAFLLLTTLMGVRKVPQGYNYTVERFGRYHKTLTPGLGLILPYIDAIGRKLNVMEQVIDVPKQEIITRDNATVAVDGVAFYQVLDARRASYEIANLQQALLNLVMTNIRTVMGSMDLDQLLSHRDEINSRLLGVIDAASEPWGIKVTRIEIKDIEPPRDLVDAMARQMKAEREKRAVILEAEGMRQADITRAEGSKAAVMLDAEGRREAAFRAAEARERTAQAEATATRLVSEATAAGDPVAINYLVADKYVRALQAFAELPNQKVFIMPMELASLAGTLGGIGQIAAAALGRNPARGAIPRVAVEALGKNAVEAALTTAVPDGTESN